MRCSPPRGSPRSKAWRPPLFWRASAGATISAKVEGTPFGLALAQPDVRPQALRNLSETLARLHAIPAPNLPPFDPSLGQALWDQQSRRMGFPAWANPPGVFVTSGIVALESDKRRVLSHNDVNPANLLWNGSQVWIVDQGGLTRLAVDAVDPTDLRSVEQLLGVLALPPQFNIPYLNGHGLLAVRSLR